MDTVNGSLARGAGDERVHLCHLTVYQKVI